MKTSALSLMPEDLEKQLKPRELADLFALLTLDKPPSDPTARKLAGSQPVVPRETRDLATATELAQYVAPGFTIRQPAQPRVALVAEHGGREGALRTDPHCVLVRSFEVPQGKRARLVIDVSHEPKGGWRLAIRVNGTRLADEQVGDQQSDPAWRTLSFDLTDPKGPRPANGKILVEVDGQRQAAYWGRLEIITE